MPLIRSVAKFLHPKWALAALVLVAAWEGYLLLKPSSPPVPVDEPRQAVAEAACWQAADRLPSPPLEGKVAVLRLKGDRTGHVTERLRAVIERTGKYAQPEPGVLDRIMEELKIEEREIGDLDAARAAARLAGTPYVLFGTISEFISDRDSGRIRMELTLADVERGHVIGGPIPVAVPDPEARGRWAWGFAWVAVWILVTALLPLVTLPLIRRVLETESNVKTLGCLLAYALASGAIALGLMRFSVTGWTEALVLAGSVVVAVTYAYFIFAIIESRR